MTRSNETWSSVSLRVTSQTLTSAAIVARLSAKASVGKDRGDPKSKSSPQAGVHDRALCIFSSPLESASLKEELDWLVDFIRSRQDALADLGQACSFDAWIGYSSGSGQAGLTIGHELLALLGDLRIDLVLDVYAREDSV